MKKQFTSAAEELIAGIGQSEMPVEEKYESSENEIILDEHYVRYIEPRSERMNLLLSKSLLKKITLESKKRKMSKNGLVNAILENYFSDENK